MVLLSQKRLLQERSPGFSAASTALPLAAGGPFKAGDDFRGFQRWELLGMGVFGKGGGAVGCSYGMLWTC